MFEEQTYDVILDRMLSRIPDTIDKREGSIIYDALAPCAVELAQAYWELDNALNESFADTASREFLVRRCAERGIEPHESTAAVVKAYIEPLTLLVPVGTRFTCGEFNYYTTTTNDTHGYYLMSCETPGSEPNGTTGDCLPVGFTEGMTSATITEVVVLGEDEEDTEALRKRYFNSFGNEASGGNIAWYQETITDIDGVGGVRVKRAWNGAGTVKCIIQNSEWGKPTPELVATVQQAIYPTSGDGFGLAPIGHVVTIAGAEEESIAITTTITYESGVTWNDIRDYCYAAVDGYLKQLNEEWQEKNPIVRIARIETALLGVIGVLDVSNTKVNGSTENYTVQGDKVVKRGSLNG